MNKSPMLNWINAVYHVNNQTKQRAAIVLSGDFEFCSETINSIINDLPYESVMWISSEFRQAISPQKAKTQLGKECDVVVFDAYNEFDLDAFGAVSGTVKAGGMLFLLIPDEKNKESYLKKSRFFNRAWSLMSDHENVYVLQENRDLPELQPSKNITGLLEEIAPPYRTVEQEQAVQAIVSSVIEKNKTAIVLSSDRGRGKSSALGIASGLLLHQPINKIIVTAPRLTNSDPVFYHANKFCTAAKQSRSKIIYKDASLEFMAPDALLETKPVADALFVDEASAIPLSMLERMLDLFPQIVFATTIHGYEGTGRGFALKFNKILDTRSPGWQNYELETPVRWIKNDPVEKWIDSMLCLNAELECVDELKDFDVNECHVNCIDRDDLIKNDSKLVSLFALLVYAHYRTKPSDLAYMLDSDSIRIYTLELNNKILAAALISQEGGFDEELSSEVYQGVRRPQGHLLAQTLSFHAGIESAASLNYARVMRIAVHPELQRRGLGSYLLRQLIDREQASGIAAIGASFGATVELMHFWTKLGFETVRMGFTKDHASGTHSAVMLKVLNQAGEDVFVESRSKFRSYIKDWLSDPLIDVSSDMKQCLENDYIDNGVNLSDYEWKDIKSFAYTHRGYEACMSPLIKLVNKYCMLIHTLDELHQTIIYSKIKNMKSWPDVVKESGVTGKSQAIECLKQAVQSLLKNINSI